MALENTVLPRLQIKQLRQLQVIAEKGSIRQAAEVLSVAQPALSRSIRMLEDELQTKIMNRGPRGIEMTEFGNTLLGYGKIIEANLRCLMEDLEETRGGSHGHVRIGVGPFEGFTLANIAIERFLKIRPEAVVQIIEGNFEDHSKRLLSGDLDIMFGPQNESGPTAGFRGELLAYSTPVIAVRSQHPLAKKKKVTFEMLADAEWINSPRGEEARARGDNIFARHGLVPPKCRVESRAGPIAAAMLLERDVVAMLPKPLLKYQIDLGLVKVLDVPTDEFKLPVQLTTLEHGAMTASHREMVKILKEVCREFGDDL